MTHYEATTPENLQHPVQEEVMDAAPRRGLGWRMLLPLLALGIIGSAILALMPARPAADSADSAGSSSLVVPRSGAPAPDLRLHTVEGQPVSLQDLRGKVVLVNFWATWCPPCRAELPDLSSVYQERKEQGFVVLAVDVKEGDALVQGFLRELPVPFPVLMDKEGTVSDRFAVTSLPTSFFIDEDGIIRGVFVGAVSRSMVEKKLDQMAQNRAADQAAKTSGK